VSFETKVDCLGTQKMEYCDGTDDCDWTLRKSRSLATQLATGMAPIHESSQMNLIVANLRIRGVVLRVIIPARYRLSHLKTFGDVPIKLKVLVGKLIEPSTLATLCEDRIWSRGACRVWWKMTNSWKNLMTTSTGTSQLQESEAPDLKRRRASFYVACAFLVVLRPLVPRGSTIGSGTMLLPFGALVCFHIAHVAVTETAYLYVVGAPLFLYYRAVRAGKGQTWLFCTVLTSISSLLM
jgi:hypothetical protein